jgi:hypothetical protein
MNRSRGSSSTPNPGPSSSSPYRRVPINRFPYIAVYLVGDDRIDVLALINIRRDPAWIVAPCLQAVRCIASSPQTVRKNFRRDRLRPTMPNAPESAFVQVRRYFTARSHDDHQPSDRRGNVPVQRLIGTWRQTFRSRSPVPPVGPLSGLRRASVSDGGCISRVGGRVGSVAVLMSVCAV